MLAWHTRQRRCSLSQSLDLEEMRTHCLRVATYRKLRKVSTEQSSSKKKKKKKKNGNEKEKKKKTNETNRTKVSPVRKYVDDPPENANQIRNVSLLQCACHGAHFCTSAVYDDDAHDTPRATATLRIILKLFARASLKICVFCRLFLLSISRSPSLFLFLSVLFADK